MEHRLGRTLRVFLVVLAAAGFYRLAVVPLVEPRIHDTAESLELTPEKAAAIRAQADRRLAAIGHVFPPGSWERENPVMLESRQMRLLFKDYHVLPDGRVNLVPCTLVVLPDRNRVTSAGPEGRTLVLRAPQGAVLEFTEPFDLRQGRLAKLVGGSLRGQVTIRGTPTGPAAEDDIEIVTRDVELDELEVRTGEMVQFRHGRSSGSGRGLVARLKPRAGPPPTAAPGALSGAHQGPNIGGADWIRLDRDVRMRIEGLAGGLVPGEGGPAPASDRAVPPVLVSCRGSLCLNVSANVITLEDHVDVIRAAADGIAEQLSADQLDIVLARRATAGQQGAAHGGLEPVEIQAKGRPVVVRSGGAAFEARAARLWYEIASRRIHLGGEEKVSLVSRGSEMEAREIDYTPGPAGDPGSLMAVGPGWIRVRSANAPAAQARWQQWLRMRPDNAGHVVSLAGDADVAVEGRGRLSAAEMHMWLDVLPGQAAATAALPAGPDLSRVRPARLLARGMVEGDGLPPDADAERVEVRTDRLELWFRHVAARPGEAAPAPAAGGAPQQAATAQAPGARHPQATAPSGGAVSATAALVRGQITISPTGNQVDEISMEGQVQLVEVPAEAAAGGQATEPSFRVRGDQLQVSRPTQRDARAVVSGRPARIDGRGIEAEGPMVVLDRGRDQLTIDGAGRLGLPLTGNGAGLESLSLIGDARPRPVTSGTGGRLDVTWQGRLDFDGGKARFVDNVVARTAGIDLRSGFLDVFFDRPFEFATPARGRAARQPDVAKIACGGGVRIDSESTDEAGRKSSERLIVQDLTIDRVSGNVSGSGPGRLTSTRVGQPLAASFAAGPPRAGGVPQPAPSVAAGDQLTFLGVAFQRGLQGNVNQRAMEFLQRVEAIWGPIAKRGDTLDPHAAAGLPEGVVLISCEALGVGQLPPLPGRQQASLELSARDNVEVEGQSFTARSARLAWSEAKDLIVFEGDGRADAQLYRQPRVGAQPQSTSAGRILYWRGLNRVDVQDARYLDFDQLGGGASRLAAPPQPGSPLVPRPQPGT